MGATDRFGAGLRQSEMLDLARSDQIPDRARDILDGNVGVDPMLVVEIDGLDPQPFQRAFDRLSDMVGAAVECAGAETMTELGGDDDVLAERLQRLSDKLLLVNGP